MAPAFSSPTSSPPPPSQIFKERGVEADVKTGLDKDELLAIIGDYDGLAVRSATKATTRMLAAAHDA